MVNVVVINGFPKSGKDTLVNYCLEYLGTYGYAISTVDFCKRIAKECGWDGRKDAKSRRFLSELKKLLTDWNDIPWKEVEKVFNHIKMICFQYGLKDSDFFLFIHSREPEEIARFKKEYNAITVLVDRSSIEGEQSNTSDTNVMNYVYDYIIDNNSTLEDLKEEAAFLIESIKITNKTKNKINEIGESNE